MPAAPYTKTTASATSSPASPPGADTPTHSDDRDELDLLDGADDGDRRIIDDDPIRSDLRAPMTFKRHHKRGSSLFGAAGGRIWDALSGGGGPDQSSGPSARVTGTNYDDDGDDHIPDASHLNIGSGSSKGAASPAGAPLDWYIEGPGRRVGYEDLTAIDWIFEYNKERQRLRSLAGGGGHGHGFGGGNARRGLVGTLRYLVDASQAWVVIVLTGLSVGAIAALIDISTDWLGDLKDGYCSSGPEGGKFYLNKRFCCYGYDQGSKCLGWRTWGETLGASDTALKWILGYFFYIVLSVRALVLRCTSMTPANA